MYIKNVEMRMVSFHDDGEPIEFKALVDVIHAHQYPDGRFVMDGMPFMIMSETENAIYLLVNEYQTHNGLKMAVMQAKQAASAFINRREDILYHLDRLFTRDTNVSTGGKRRYSDSYWFKNDKSDIHFVVPYNEDSTVDEKGLLSVLKVMRDSIAHAFDNSTKARFNFILHELDRYGIVVPEVI